MTMIAMNLPEKTVRNLLDYINEFLDNACSQQFIREAEEDKNRIKRAIGRAMGRPKSILNDFRLKDMIRK